MQDYLIGRHQYIGEFSGYSSVPGFLADTGEAGLKFGGIFLQLTVIHFFSESLSAVPGTAEFRR